MKEKIKKIIEEISGEKVDEKDFAFDVENWDSLNQITLLSELESEFDCSFEPEDIERMNTFEEIIEIVKKKSH
jgi:acyl carrier protein